MNHDLRGRKAWVLFKDFQLGTRMALSLYKVTLDLSTNKIIFQNQAVHLQQQVAEFSVNLALHTCTW